SPRIILSLAQPGDQERDKFDQDGEFSVQYSARAFREAGEFRVEHGILVPLQEEHDKKRTSEQKKEITAGISLLAVKGASLDYTDLDNRVVVTLPSPTARHRLGEARSGSIYFKLENCVDKKYLSDHSSYELRVKTQSTLLVESLPI